MLLINYETNLILTWPENFFIVGGTTANQVLTFAIADAKRYVPVVTESIRDNEKLLQ